MRNQVYAAENITLEKLFELKSNQNTCHFFSFYSNYHIWKCRKKKKKKGHKTFKEKTSNYDTEMFVAVITCKFFEDSSMPVTTESSKQNAARENIIGLIFVEIIIIQVPCN